VASSKPPWRRKDIPARPAQFEKLPNAMAMPKTESVELR